MIRLNGMPDFNMGGLVHYVCVLEVCLVLVIDCLCY